MRKVPLVEDQFYHVYNRGTDKRNIIENDFDMQRFMQSIDEFNIQEPIGSIYENTFRKKEKLLGTPSTKLKLVEIVAYCINQNHYHFILRPLCAGGIEKFMQKLGGGYTRYFNEKHDRTGALFQGRFKSTHINSNSLLMQMSAYVNLNNKVHQLGTPSTKSSWNEYIGLNNEGICSKDIILGQFKNIEDYKKFAEESIEGILKQRKNDKAIAKLLIE